MEQLLHNLHIQLSNKLYLKNPNSSELGQRIVVESIVMIDELGLEQFTFKKLAEKLSTTESSVYRYFDNKHKLLLYLVSWYWTWLEYRLVFGTTNVDDAKQKLQVAIDVLTFPSEGFDIVSGMNMPVLSRLIVNESSKTFLTKEIDKENQEGYFSAYKAFCNRVQQIILEINPKSKYPKALVTTLIEGVHIQRFFANHFPALTEFSSDRKELSSMFYELLIQKLSTK